MNTADPKCIHCYLFAPVREFLSLNPEVPVERVVQDLGTLIAELIDAGVRKPDWETALTQVAQSIRADLFRYERDKVAITSPSSGTKQ